MSGSLFVFAHRGEAGAFLKDRDWEPVPFFFSGLYRSSQEGILLLITGEGGQNVSERLSAVLSHFESIRLVVNLGIAGALDERGLKQGEIHSVRTVYRYVGDQPVFRSFTTSDTGAGVDCISSDVRVLEYGLVEKLLPFAPIVDREAWFIGSVAQLYRKEFQIYKLISDYAGKEDQCLEIRDRAPEYSRSLHRFFKVSFPVPERKNQREKTEFPSALYVTVTQRRRLAKLLEVLTSRTGRLPASIWGEPSVKAILKGDTSSKRKTAMVIKWLEEWVNPFTLPV